MGIKETGTLSEPRPARGGCIQGIVVADGRRGATPSEARTEPRIAAFIWGGKVRPSPTLPFGRWKGAA